MSVAWVSSADAVLPTLKFSNTSRDQIGDDSAAMTDQRAILAIRRRPSV
jgi:hypothetical protein